MLIDGEVAVGHSQIVVAVPVGDGVLWSRQHFQHAQRERLIVAILHAILVVIQVNCSAHRAARRTDARDVHRYILRAIVVGEVLDALQEIVTRSEAIEGCLHIATDRRVLTGGLIVRVEQVHVAIGEGSRAEGDAARSTACGLHAGEAHGAGTGADDHVDGKRSETSRGIRDLQIGLGTFTEFDEDGTEGLNLCGYDVIADRLHERRCKGDLAPSEATVALTFARMGGRLGDQDHPAPHHQTRPREIRDLDVGHVRYRHPLHYLCTEVVREREGVCTCIQIGEDIGRSAIVP